MTLINKERVMDFLKDEAAERVALMKPTDPPAVKIADVAFLQALEVVGTYVEEVAQPVAA
jgi:hypothetical protein